MPAGTPCSSQRLALEAIAQPMALDAEGRGRACPCGRLRILAGGDTPSQPLGPRHRGLQASCRVLAARRTHVNKDWATHSEERTYVGGGFFFLMHLGRVGEGVVNFFLLCLHFK